MALALQRRQLMPFQAINACDMRPKCVFFLLLAWLVWLPSPTFAADEPDLIFRRSTVFKWVSPNDKLATYGVDDPEVEGVACHFTVPEKGGFTGLPPDRPDPFQGQAGAGGRYVPRAPLVVFQENADRPWLRRQAKRPRLYGLFRQADRRIAEELDVLGADHALGRGRRCGAEMRGFHSLTGRWRRCRGSLARQLGH